MAEPILPNLSTAAPVSIEGSAAEQLRQLIEANKTQAGQLEDLARNLEVPPYEFTNDTTVLVG